MSRTVKWILGLLIGSFLLAALGFALPFVMLLYLLGGWIWFLVRNLQEATVSVSGVVTASIASVLFVACLHWLLVWFSSATVATDDSIPKKPWRFAWTLGIAGLVMLMFVAGTAMIGLTHQLVWVATSEERIVSSPIREIAYRTSSQNNLKHIGLGLLNEDEKNDSLPAGATCDSNGRMLHGWQTTLLPHIEEWALHERIDLTRPWNDPANAEVFKTQVHCYRYPERSNSPTRDASGYAISTYAGNVHVLGGTRRWKVSEITDGASKTILAGEVNSEFKPWGSPTNWRDPQDGLNKSRSGFGGPWAKSNITNFLMADGSVLPLSNDIDPAVLKALSTPASGDEVKGNY